MTSDLPRGHDPQRHVIWFSCGAASAYLAKLVIEENPDAVPVYCDTSRNEHPDNARFRTEVEQWIGKPVTVIGSEKYATVEEVFAKRRYMAGIAGAPCTVALKKVPRFAWQRADDIHHFGLTADETDRIDRFRRNNPELLLEWRLRDLGIDKDSCLRAISDAGIRLPRMYELGYRNNNCIGCVKATSSEYWTRIRRDFPDVFARRVEQSRDIRARLVRWQGERIFLDELPQEAPVFSFITEDVSCGPECADQGGL